MLPNALRYHNMLINLTQLFFKEPMFLVKNSQIFHFPHISSLNSEVTHTYIRSFDIETSEMVATVYIAGEPVHRVEISSMFFHQPPQPHHQQKTQTAASECRNVIWS